MYKKSDKPKENRSRAVFDSIPPVKKSNNSPFHLADNRPDAIKQREIQQQVFNQHTVSDSTANVSPVQRVQKDATVTWGVTHIVAYKDKSLFGGENALANELNPDNGGQLKKGDRLIVDTTPVVISRRGSNQENKDKRQSDEKGDKVYEWVRVLKIIPQTGKVTSLEDNAERYYVRKETIQLDKDEEQQDTTTNDIELKNISDWNKEEIPRKLGEIAKKWGGKGLRERSRSIGVIKINKEDREGSRKKASGRYWKQEDDGWDVALDMAYENHKRFEPSMRQWRIKAVMKGTEDLVGVLIVEERENEPLYLRWMIGNPEIRGGGSALLAAVKKLLQQKNTPNEIEVTSAFSAKTSYTKSGFKVKDEQVEVKEGEEFELVLTKEEAGKKPIHESYDSFEPKPYTGPEPESYSEERDLKKELDEEENISKTVDDLLNQ